MQAGPRSAVSRASPDSAVSRASPDSAVSRASPDSAVSGASPDSAVSRASPDSVFVRRSRVLLGDNVASAVIEWCLGSAGSVESVMRCQQRRRYTESS